MVHRLSPIKMRFAVFAFVVGAGSAITAEPASPSSGEVAATRVEVTLSSDGETWVSITNVQAPAKFQTRKVSLPPGDYEVVGRRRGYRDVQISLPVRSGTTPQALK